MTDNDLVFLDGEMGGLDDELHPSLEFAYAVGKGPVMSLRLAHDVRDCDEVALKINHYDERQLGDRHTWARPERIYAFWSALDGKTLVVSNPSHDERFLLGYARQPGNEHLLRFGTGLRAAGWRHRKVDISSMAMLTLDHDRPKGMHAIAVELRALGYDIPHPDHTAVRDVACLRECYYALRQFAELQRFPQRYITGSPS